MTRTIRAFAAGLALWSLPVAAQAGAPASKARGAECKCAPPQERAQSRTPAARDTGRGILALGWLSTVGRQSSPLLP